MNKKRLVSICLASLMVLSPTTAFASSIGSVVTDADTSTGATAETVVGSDSSRSAKTSYETKEITEDATSDFNVYASQGQSSEVLLPKTLIMDGAAAKVNKCQYVVGVKGDINGDSAIQILPDNTVSLTSKGKKDAVIANVSQNKTSFASSEINADTWTTSVGTVATDADTTGNGLTAGQWNGTYKFNTGFTNNPGIQMKTWDVSKDKIAGDDVEMAYYQPEQTSTQTVTGAISSLFTPMKAYAADETEVVTEEGGTVYIRGTGAMQDNLSDLFYDADKLAQDCFAAVNTNSIKLINPKTYVDNIHSSDIKYYYDDTTGKIGCATFTFGEDGKIVSQEEHYMFGTAEELKPFDDWERQHKSEYFKFIPKKIIIEDGVTNIGAYAFNGCTEITSLDMSDTVTSIDANAFSGCKSLTKVNLSQNLNTIGERAFAGTGISGISLPSSLSNIGEYAFASSGLESVTIPGSVNTVGKYAFERCTLLTTAIIENGVAHIDESFMDCPVLKSVDIPNTVLTMIESFSGCDELKTISIPASVTDMEYAFYGASTLRTITVDESNQTYCSVNSVVYSKDMSTVIKYPEGKMGTSYVIPDSVTEIYDGSFYDANFKTVTIPSSVESIGEEGFAYSSLSTVNIPGSVVSIGNHAFKNCDFLSSVTMNAGVKTVGSAAFYWCSSLDEVYAPNTITTVGASAFTHMNIDSVIYCQSSANSAKFNTKISKAYTTIVVDESKFA